MITRDVLKSAGRLGLGGPSVAIVGLLLFLACNRESTRADIVGPEEPTPEEVSRGPISLANLMLPFSGSTNSDQTAFAITQSGTAGNVELHIPVPSNVHAVLRILGQGSGPGIWSQIGSAGTGPAGRFTIHGSGNSAAAVDVSTVGTGTGVNVLTTGGGRAGVFRINNTSTFAFALEGTTNGRAHAVFGGNSGTGGAALFQVTSTGNNKPAVEITTVGTGPALRVSRNGSGSLAVFQLNNNNRIRFTHDGKGIFNGGTQTGGADVAEAFAVEGRASAYEPGDVLVISTRSDRTVEKTDERYSTRVAGVYATKPGVLLTERGVDDGLEGLVPVGVIGVIPTKVSAENGPIRRGDLLVTASRSGHAMRAKPVVIQGVTLYPTGAILGRAMQEFRGPGDGRDHGPCQRQVGSKRRVTPTPHGACNMGE